MSNLGWEGGRTGFGVKMLIAVAPNIAIRMNYDFQKPPMPVRQWKAL